MEDPRDKVMKTLESNGTLDYIKAQLRSKVYSVLNDSNQFLQKPDTAKVTETKLGELAAELIRDFMEYFSLNFTLNIFIPECHLNSKKKELNFIENKLKIRASHDKPILFTVLEKLINETTAFSSQSSRLNTASTTDSTGIILVRFLVGSAFCVVMTLFLRSWLCPLIFCNADLAFAELLFLPASSCLICSSALFRFSLISNI